MPEHLRRNAATDVADTFNALADRLKKLLDEFPDPPDDKTPKAAPQAPRLRLVIHNERRAA